MSYYLSRDGQQQGPYSEDELRSWISSGEVAPQEQIWQEGWSEWRPISEALNLPTIAPTGSPPAAHQIVPHQQQAAPQQTVVHVHSETKQGALIGGWICFAIGLIIQVISASLLIPIYAILYTVSLILSVVAMSQRRILGGVLLLIASLAVPTIVVILFLVVLAAAGAA